MVLLIALQRSTQYMYKLQRATFIPRGWDLFDQHWGRPLAASKLHSVIEWVSIECRTTKTKVITLANQKRRRQSSKPIKTRSNYTQPTQSAGKCARASHYWFWFHFWLVETCVARTLNQSPSEVIINQSNSQITFDTKLKTALEVVYFSNLKRSHYF